MNLYTKYAPLAYTYHTRRKNLRSMLRCLLLDIAFSSVSIVYLYISHTISFSTLLLSGILFIGLFYVFTIFYEIGYIHNDIIASKQEKAPNLRVNEQLSNTFITLQIIMRIILGSGAIGVLWHIDSSVAIIYTTIIGITLVIFYIHNKIRNYFWNFITFFLLRFMKFSIIVPIFYFCIHTFTTPLYLYITFLFILMQFGININVYNTYYGGETKYPQTLMLFYLFIGCIIFWIFSREGIFATYAIAYLIVFIIETPKKYFSIKNNR